MQGIFECVLCRTRFNEEDVRELEYFPSTQVCAKCYERGQQADYTVWCFGKPNVRALSGHILDYGYDADARACREECPDRKLCRLVVLSGTLGGNMGKDAEGLKCPFRQTQSMTAKAWMMCATEGIMIEDLVKWVRRQGGDPGRILRIMRSGQRFDVRWLVDESNGFLRITYQGGGVHARSQSDSG